MQSLGQSRNQKASEDISQKSRGSIAQVGREEIRPPEDGQSSATPTKRQRTLGIALVSFGVLTLALGSISGASTLAGLGLAAFLIGLLVIYIPSRPSLAPEIVEAMVLSSLANLERVLRDFSPDSKAVYMKVQDRLETPRVFLPLSDNPAASTESIIEDDGRFLLMDARNPHRTGLILEAPGASVLALMEKESGIELIDLGSQELIDAIRTGLVESLELAADVKGLLTSESVKLMIKDGPLRSLSDSIVRLAPGVAQRLGCPICSCAICAAVKSLKENMILEDASHEKGYHKVHLQPA